MIKGNSIFSKFGDDPVADQMATYSDPRSSINPITQTPYYPQEQTETEMIYETMNQIKMLLLVIVVLKFICLIKK